MGYFSNGTEGMSFEAKWCDRCIHQENKKGQGCPVMYLHLTWNYEACNGESAEIESAKRAKFVALETFIPTSKDGGNAGCKMFVARKSPRIDVAATEEQQELTFAEEQA